MYENMAIEVVNFLKHGAFQDETPKISFHGSSKIYTLRIEGDTMCETKSDYGWYRKFIEILAKLPSLRHFSHTRVSTWESDIRLQNCFTKLETLHIQEYNITLEAASQVIDACKSLRTFSFWPLSAFEYSNFSALYTALRKHRSSLEHVKFALVIDVLPAITAFPMGAFADFPCLIMLRIRRRFLCD
jgi:hypothetical protein